MTINVQKLGQHFFINWPDNEGTLAHIITTDPLEAMRATITSGAAVEMFIAVRTIAANTSHMDGPSPG